MKRSAVRMLAFACVVALCVVLSGCAATSTSSAGSGDGSADSQAAASSSVSAASDSADVAGSTSSALAPGEYTVKVKTDSSMFHVNEAKDGTGELTVTDDGMSVHITLVSKRITNLYAGTVDQAKEDPDGVINPTTDKVTYSDGIEEEVYGFDVPVPALDEEFDVAILGSKGSWYDHKVIVSDPISR